MDSSLLPVLAFVALGVVSLNGVLPSSITKKGSITHISSYVGSHVILNCSIPAFHNEASFNIVWYKYNQPLRDVTYRPMHSGSQMLLLNFSNLLLADAGDYLCVITGLSSVINRTFILQVKEPTSAKQPTITDGSLQNQTTTYGQSVVFSCEVKSLSVPYIEWYFKIVLPFSSANSTNASRLRTKRNSLKKPHGVPTLIEGGVSGRSYRGELHLYNVTYKDSGTYVCQAFNRYGKSLKEAYLTVVPEPALSKKELERKYLQLFGDNPQFPLALIISLPVGVLVLSCAVLVRALERSKQANLQLAEIDPSQPQRKPTVEMNGDVANATLDHAQNECNVKDEESHRACTFEDQRYESLSSSDSSSTPEVGETVSSEELTHAHYGQSLRSSTEVVVTSTQTGLNTCMSSEALELDWEGLDLTLPDHVELVPMSKEVEV